MTQASHGGVCNVMKEVGIQYAYSLMTNTVKESNERASFEQVVLRALRVLREVVCHVQKNNDKSPNLCCR